MSVCYLDGQDEITDAVGRLRTASDKRVIMVLPPGSRIGTSRINFRLLLREADTRGVTVDLVSGDSEARSLAQSAGMRAFGTVGDAERDEQLEQTTAIAPRGALEPTAPPELTARTEPAAGTQPTAPPEPTARTQPTARLSMPRPKPSPPMAASHTPPMAASHAPPTAAYPALGTSSRGARRGARSDTSTYAVAPRTATAAYSAAGHAEAWTGEVAVATEARSRTRRRSRARRILGWGIRLALLLAIIGGVAYGAYLYLPTATIALTPGTQTFGPTTFTVTADPGVAVADAATGRVPAQHVPIPLSATDTFPATGREVIQSKATGTVTFTSSNTFLVVPLPEGTLVSTAAGTEFATTKAAVLPKAAINQRSSVDVPIRASNPGPSGNVAAGTITSAPKSVTDLLVTVTNPGSTSGGKRVEALSVTRADYDAAMAQLNDRLNSDLQTALSNPTTPPEGLKLYPETASLGRLNASAAAGDLVGTQADTFDLSVDTLATVLGVDEALVTSVAGRQLLATAPQGVRVFPETVSATLSPATVNGTLITYQVTAQALQYRPVDASDLQNRVAGRTVSEARSILQAYGNATVSIWPDFVPTIPQDVRRINLTVENPEIPR